MGHNLPAIVAEKGLHMLFLHREVQGEWFNLTAEQRTLGIQRMIHAQQVNASGGPLKLVYGRCSWPVGLRVPHSIGTTHGSVYAAWNRWEDDDLAAMETIVTNGTVTGNVTQDQVDFLSTVLENTKVGSTGNLPKRLGQYTYGFPVTPTLCVREAESSNVRLDEGNRHQEIVGYPVAQPGQFVAPPPNSPHISGEWMRCTEPQRQAVSDNTHNEAYNAHLPTSQGEFTRQPWQLNWQPEHIQGMLQLGLVTNDELQRNEILFPGLFV